MYKISIIIPAHNEGKYLEECLKSIIEQTMDFREFEIIMVDDASEDNTFEIMKKYADKYDNFFAYKRDEKSGSAGLPRNEAIQHATGKYLMFIDADDTYEKDACEKMYNAIEETGADFVTANAIDMTEDGEKTDVFMSREKYVSQEISIKNIKYDVLPMSCSACFKIINTEFVKKNNLHFLHGVPAEDSYFSYTSLMKSNKAYYLSEVIYNYRKRYSENNLSVSTTFSEKYFENINYSYGEIYNEFKKNNYLEYYDAYYLNGLFYILFNFITSNKIDLGQRKRILTMLKWFFDIYDLIGIDLEKLNDSTGVIDLIVNVHNNNIDEAVSIAQKLQDDFNKLSREEVHNIKYDLQERAKVLERG